ncbi:hypothetical protein [Sphingomonas sp.]|uniref:hypothetical protein n=1 Tax=Sphingomonas sp. TaxID=28214 RepID=UPI001ED6995B|nr:hypothetical protein [Sphingomonas sp.]MBX3595731.1 hypothetical protein [Sphingomonas sp.]
MPEIANLIFAYRYSAEKFDHDFELAETLQEVRRKIKPDLAGDDGKTAEPSVASARRNSFDGSDISSMQDRFVGHILSFKSLISLTVPMRYVFHAGSLKRDLFDVAESEYEFLEEYEGYRVFSLRPDQFDNFDSAVDKVSDIARGLSVLPGSNAS